MDSSSCIRMLEEGEIHSTVRIHNIQRAFSLFGIAMLLFAVDHKDLSTEIETLRENLKPKVAALHQLEGELGQQHTEKQGLAGMAMLWAWSAAASFVYLS